jgi:hypothetical protein
MHLKEDECKYQNIGLLVENLNNRTPVELGCAA